MRLRRIIQLTLAVIITAGLGVYIYHQSQAFIAGPSVTITHPESGATFQKPFITISGTAEHISHLSLNDNQIYTNEEGVFEEKLLLLPGYNIITIAAQDKFGRDIHKTLELVLKEEQPQSPSIGTSSVSAQYK